VEEVEQEGKREERQACRPDRPGQPDGAAGVQPGSDSPLPSCPLRHKTSLQDYDLPSVSLFGWDAERLARRRRRSEPLLPLQLGWKPGGTAPATPVRKTLPQTELGAAEECGGRLRRISWRPPTYSPALTGVPTGVADLRPSGYEPDELPDCSASASIAESVVPSALASLSAWTMEGVLSARSTAPM
jgi:hypothetical protein